MFSSHAGAPVDKPLLDSDPNLYEIQKGQKPIVERMQGVGLHFPSDHRCQSTKIKFNYRL
jgi:hypothetical protein